MTLRNELIVHASSNLIQRLAQLEPNELFFFIKLFTPTISRKDWTDFLEQITSMINVAKQKKKELQFLNFDVIQTNVLASVAKIILNAAKRNTYECMDDLIIIAEENLNRFIAKK